MKVRINEQFDAEVTVKNGSVLIDGEPFPAQVKRTGTQTFHILAGTRSYVAELLETDAASRESVIRVNGKVCRVAVTDEYTALLSRLGMDGGASRKLLELKAPMPGLVLHILVKEGDEVKKNDSLITLEAMKMENVLRSPGDGRIAAIHVTVGSKTEKNQVLITFS